MRYLILCATAALLTTACDDETAGPGGGEAGTLTVNTSEGWAFVAFEGGQATEVTVSEPTASTEWDIAFNATRVMLNGGAAGPRGVGGFCICQNNGASDAEVMAMTSASELADFEQVTQTEPPQDAGWEYDELTPAIDEWYVYNPTTHVVSAASSNVFAVRTSSGTSFAKLRVIDIANATQQHAGDVSIEFAHQAVAGGAFAATDTVVLDASTGERVNLATGAVVTTGGWDLEVSGWTIRLNGGVSGSGNAGAYLTDVSFEELLDAGAAPSGAFSRDGYEGVFSGAPWYRYNIDGQHTIFPTYQVYLLDTPDGVYKVQLTGYYSATGETRHITFRYEQLD